METLNDYLVELIVDKLKSLSEPLLEKFNELSSFLITSYYHTRRDNSKSSQEPANFLINQLLLEI